MPTETCIECWKDLQEDNQVLNLQGNYYCPQCYSGNNNITLEDVAAHRAEMAGKIGGLLADPKLFDSEENV